MTPVEGFRLSPVGRDPVMIENDKPSPFTEGGIEHDSPVGRIIEE